MRHPVWGLADLHAHPMSHLAFSGAIWGTPDSTVVRYDARRGGNLRPVFISFPDIEALPIGSRRRLAMSLPPCDGEYHARLLLGPDDINRPVAINVDRTSGTESLMKSLERGKTHDPRGFPDFTSWPLYSTHLHQQMYIEWIFRAFQGGLRLMVALAVDSYVLRRARRYDAGLVSNLAPFTLRQGLGPSSGFGRDPTPQGAEGDLKESGLANPTYKMTIREQLREMKNLIQRHSNSNAPVGSLQNFMALARTPADARRIIQGGRLAIVLGVETANIIPSDAELSEANRIIDELHDELDVRHIIPIHHVDNWFGGSAISAAGDNLDLLNSEQEFITHSFWQPIDGSNPDSRDDPRGELPPGPIQFKLLSKQRRLTFRPGSRSDAAAYWASDGAWGINIYSEEIDLTEQYRRLPSHMNSKGLNPRNRNGVNGIKKLMSKGMIIDIDHMSSLSFSDTLDIAENVIRTVGNEVERGYPVVSSHSRFRSLFPARPPVGRDRTGPFQSPYRSTWADEWSISERMIRRIFRVGGMVTLFINTQITLAWVLSNTSIDSDPVVVPAHRIARATTRSVAQKLLYAIDMMERYGSGLHGIALGSDFGGISPKPAPRAGRENARNFRRIAYGPGSRTNPALHIPLSISRTGTKSFDFNETGCEHYGLIPDLLQDLKLLGITDEQMSHLFSGAERYIQVWEKCERMKASPDLAQT